MTPTPTPDSSAADSLAIERHRREQSSAANPPTAAGQGETLDRLWEAEALLRESLVADRGSWKLKGREPGCSVMGASEPEDCPCRYHRVTRFLNRRATWEPDAVRPAIPLQEERDEVTRRASAAVFEAAVERTKAKRAGTACHDCGLKYGGHGWADLVVPDYVWAQISPTHNEGGLLCANCMVRRAEALQIRTEARFTSGPFAPDAVRGETDG